MAKIQDIDLPYLEFAEAAAPSTPASGIVRIYAKTDGSLYQKDDAGTETGLAGSGGSSAFVGAKVYHSTTQSINNNSVTAATFDSEEFDTDGFHAGGAPTRLTIPSGKDGTYLVRGMCVFAQNATGVRIARFLKNGTTILRTQYSDGGNSSAANSAGIGAIVQLVATDYLEFTVYQTSGGSLNIGNASASEEQTSFEIALLGT